MSTYNITIRQGDKWTEYFALEINPGDRLVPGVCHDTGAPTLEVITPSEGEPEHTNNAGLTDEEVAALAEAADALWPKRTLASVRDVIESTVNGPGFQSVVMPLHKRPPLLEGYTVSTLTAGDWIPPTPTTQTPCPDCAHTDHPGEYVGLFSRGACPTCEGSGML